MVCPNLKELGLGLCADDETFDIKDLIDMAMVRALGGAKLRTVSICDGQGGVDPGEVLELRKHVFNLECGHGVVRDSDGGEEG